MDGASTDRYEIEAAKAFRTLKFENYVTLKSEKVFSISKARNEKEVQSLYTSFIETSKELNLQKAKHKRLLE